jgi:hypothetical protein
MTATVPTRRSARLSVREFLSDHDMDGSSPKSLDVHSNWLASAREVSKDPGQGPRNCHQPEDSDTVTDNSTTRSQRNETSKKHKKTTSNTYSRDADTMAYIMKTATAEDRQSWKGWCEIESEPVSRIPKRKRSTVWLFLAPDQLWRMCLKRFDLL